MIYDSEKRENIHERRNANVPCEHEQHWRLLLMIKLKFTLNELKITLHMQLLKTSIATCKNMKIC